MKIHKLVIPTPFYIGPINIYLVEDDPLTLIDTGPKTDEAMAALKQQLLAIVAPEGTQDYWPGRGLKPVARAGDKRAEYLKHKHG